VILSCGIFSEEYIASTFRVKKYAKQETSIKQAVFQMVELFIITAVRISDPTIRFFRSQCCGM
jgi:hypothetical protein